MATVDQMERLKFLLSVYQQPGDPAQKPEIRRRIAQALTLLWGDPRFDQAQALTRKAGLQPVIGQDGVMTVQPTVIQNPNTKKAAPGAPIGGVGMTGSAPVAKTVERGEGGFNRGNPAAATSVSTSSPFGPGNPRGAGQGQLDAGSVAPGLGPAGTGGPGGDLASGLGSVGGDNQNWDTALLDQQLGSIPSGSYLSGSTGGTVAGMLPSIDPTSQQNAAAAGFMLSRDKNDQGMALRDTAAAQYVPDILGSASMLGHLLGGSGAASTWGADDPVQNAYQAEQFTKQMLTPGSGYVNPQTVLRAMQAKLADPNLDPNMKMNYIKYALDAIKPYVGADQYAALSAQVGRIAQDYANKQVNAPLTANPNDFLGGLRRAGYGD